jgi:cystathionine beta-lyase family protein involved in aluminum resistance
MRRRLTTDTKALEVPPVATPLAPVPQTMPGLKTPIITAGTIVQFSAEENDPAFVRVTWQARVWSIGKADWDLAKRL